MLRPSIARVWARNFRSIESAELELGDLTVLVGPNASGKSNLLDILGFLSDAARDGLERAIERRGGIGSFGHRSGEGRALAPEFGLRMSLPIGTLEYSFALARLKGGGYRVKREYAGLTPAGEVGAPYEIEITDRRLSKENLVSSVGEGKSEPKRTRRGWFSRVPLAKRLIRELGDQSLLLMPAERLRITALLVPFGSESSEISESAAFRLHVALEGMKDCLRSIFLYRLFPNALRDPQVAADSYPLAAGGENLASTLRNLIKQKSRFLQDLKEALAFAVPGIRDLRVKQAGSYYVVELKHEKETGSENGQWFDLSHESDGTIRLLAMLIALFQEPAPSLMCLEEPELAIHPGAMAVLADTMKEASLRGQVLLSTHSPELINLFPIESIRAVSAEDGSTRVGGVVEHQLTSLIENLFLPGELHSMEGLQPAITSN